MSDMPIVRDREAELEDCLRELYGLVERHELVRNTMADGQPDWVLRMAKMVGTLKKAQELVGSHD